MMAIDAPVRHRGPVLIEVPQDAWEERGMEAASLAIEARVHARYNIPRAERLCAATLREGLFAEFHEANAILGSLKRLAARHERKARLVSSLKERAK